MTQLEKGSALPRSLSSSDRIYLAPLSGRDISYLHVGHRKSSGEIAFYQASLEAVRDWARSTSALQTDMEDQIRSLEAFSKQSMVWNMPSPLIMGIVNVTPDSFSDGGHFFDAKDASRQVDRLLEEGAHILDIGGESTRPGADPVSVQEELDRVLPIIEACRGRHALISIDTRKAAVMEAALKAGAGLVNDVTALEYEPDSLPVVAGSDAKLCLMHSSADPKVMQDNPTYDHALFDVIDYLRGRIEVCEQAGIQRNRIAVDPGIGFGKTLEHNLLLLKGLGFFHALGCPVLLGVSRKSFIGRIDQPGDAQERIGGSLSALLQGFDCGAQIFRVHDVQATRQALAVSAAIEKTGLKG